MVLLPHRAGYFPSLTTQLGREVASQWKITTMCDNIDQTEGEMLTYEVSDEALETATSTSRDKAENFTVSFCTGLIGCPA
jgi:hypothetical protein